MEEYYGVKLFSFQGKKLRLTREGNYLKQSLASLFHNEEYLREQMACLSNPMQNLHFGATLTVGEFMMTKPLVKILKEHPSAKVSMTVKNTQILLELLDSGQIDFAVVEQELADGKLRRIPMKDFSLWHEISFVWKKDTLFALKIPEVLQWF